VFTGGELFGPVTRIIQLHERDFHTRRRDRTIRTFNISGQGGTHRYARSEWLEHQYVILQHDDAGYYVVEASAGNDNEATATVGNPGDITGTFNFTQGNVIKILVGQRGWLGDPRPGWGGGGGSFVASSTDSPLIVAGGCGATHTGYSSITPCQNATTGTAGNVNSTGGSVTWTAGYGATGGQGGDGAGFYGNGTVGNGSGGGTAPSAFINGGLGAPRGGGFGGGAAVTNTYGGGGGGYSGGQGGGSGGSPNAFTGGGGGSYNSGTNQTNTLYGNGATSMVNGFVTITKN